MRLFRVFFFVSSVKAWSYGWPEEWGSKWLPTGSQTVIGSSDSCKTSHLTAFEMSKSKDPIFFSTGGLDNFISPKMRPLNGTAGEQWEFDGVSDDAKLAFVFGFYRDPNYAILGSGNLRVSVEMAWPNGSRFAQVDYPTDNIIEECDWGTRGIWRSNDFNYTFEITADMKRARVGMHTPQVTGIVSMTSTSQPRYPDGRTYPSENSTSEALPYFHFVEPIPVARAHVDMTILGEKFAWDGLGGMERLWGAFSWFTCLQGMNVIRILAGPYSLSMLSFTSNIKKGREYPSIALFDNGEPVFSSQNTEESDVNDYFSFTKTYDGKVTGTLRDKVTGYELELVSPGRQLHWTFLIDHANLAFEYILGRGTGGSGFSAWVNGGRMGREQFKGIALTEALTFPKKSPLFRPQYSED
ncbi:diels-alderase phmD [Parastagonospora nodorum]|nr:diels-alderase phmD [Parastagonospora nodorum]QRC90792.1 diels-alderase phmD [Parastagonospora nodorum SN15]KAH3935038.1 diels-alderase phmD [Parastagonospora nodorum]KAH3943722.1 diels-alderase phmD [Parastagonospora nodorum]KAH3987532.1 diels-alderase phmD [Parastagonospora nodorum]